jgi:pimeloyl-ACP methyl ester carboxylesterase
MQRLSRRRLALVAGSSLLLSRRSVHAAEPIDESGFVRIGGIDQWIAIQGRDSSNPAIVYLHGGPSEALSPFLRFFLPWEQDFTVVNWDQRGAGKTYGRNGPSTPNMTLDQMVDDAAEVAEHVRRRLSQRKVILVGQSWGSFLGVHAIKRRPELFHAFVGTGQVVSVPATLQDWVRWARQQATAAGDQAALKALDDAAAEPPDRRLDAEAKASRKWIMSSPDLPIANTIGDFINDKSNPANGEVADYVAGNKFSAAKLSAVLDTEDLRTLGLDMPVPFFVVQGREDHIVGFDAARLYVEDVRAPAKAFVPIDGGHYACFTNADQFLAAMRKYVQPLVK